MRERSLNAIERNKYRKKKKKKVRKEKVRKGEKVRINFRRPSSANTTDGARSTTALSILSDDIIDCENPNNTWNNE